jgi:hypothetical protein
MKDEGSERPDNFKISLIAFSAAYLTIFAINLLTSGVTSFEQEEA